MKRIGMLTSGGDCQALNAAMRGVVKCLYTSGEDVEIFGFCRDPDKRRHDPGQFQDTVQADQGAG